MKIEATRDSGGEPCIVLSDVFSGVGIKTDMGLFGIAQRDDGIEVMLDGKTVWTSHELPGGSEERIPGEFHERVLASGVVRSPDESNALESWTIGPGRVLCFNGRPAFRISSDNDYDLALAKRIELIGEPRVDGDERLSAPQVDEAATFIVDLLNQSGTTIDNFRKPPLSPGGPGVRLPDGSGAFTASWPLPKTHWLYAEGRSEPPMPYRIGVSPFRDQCVAQIQAAARYAIRASTMNGKETDFDPDAMVQNFVVGLLGYWTEDGFRTT